MRVAAGYKTAVDGIVWCCGAGCCYGSVLQQWLWVGFTSRALPVVMAWSKSSKGCDRLQSTNNASCPPVEVEFVACCQQHELVQVVKLCCSDLMHKGLVGVGRLRSALGGCWGQGR